MSLSKYDFVWQFVNDYKVVRDNDSIPDDLKCILCKKLMVDACQGECGCHYCFQCLQDYIKEGEKICPGGKEDCGDNRLVLDGNIRSLMLNKKISKLKVNCPNQPCDYKVELIQMCDHLRVCPKQPIECPYVPIGCCNKKTSKDLMLSHIHEDALTHTELLIESFNNMKHEVSELKEDSREKEIKIAALEDKLKSEINGLRNDIRDVKETLMALINEIKINNENEREERERKLIYWSKWSKLNPNIDVDYVWKFTDCSKTMDDHIYSESFYANKYKFCLSIYLTSNDDTGVYCWIMEGENDDVVVWPMKYDVTLSILDQVTLKPHKTWIIKYDTFDNKAAFNQTKEINDQGIYLDDFITYSSIKDNRSIVIDDSVVVAVAFSDR